MSTHICEESLERRLLWRLQWLGW